MVVGYQQWNIDRLMCLCILYMSVLKHIYPARNYICKLHSGNVALVASHSAGDGCRLTSTALQWRHNEHDSVSNHQPHVCLLNRLFGRRSKKTSKLRVTGLCVGNSPGAGEFPAQMASNAENVSIWWRHHGHLVYLFDRLYVIHSINVSFHGIDDRK